MAMLRMPKKKLDWDAFWRMPLPRFPKGRLAEAVSEDREESEDRLLGR